MRIGIISDTHGYLDPQVAGQFAGADHIVHAGDIGAMSVIHALAEIAPVTAVHGNVDAGREPAAAFPETQDLTLAGQRIHVVHRPQDAGPDAGTDIVIYGHTHAAGAEERDGRLYVNPGAAGRQGFHRERTIALLDVEDGRRSVRFVVLGPRRGG